MLLGPGLICDSCKNNSALPFTQTETAGRPQFSINDRNKGAKREMWKTETRKIVTTVLFDYEYFADFAILGYFHRLLWEKTTYSNHGCNLFKEWTRPVKAQKFPRWTKETKWYQDLDHVGINWFRLDQGQSTRRWTTRNSSLSQTCMRNEPRFGWSTSRRWLPQADLDNVRVDQLCWEQQQRKESQQSLASRLAAGAG